MSKMKHKGITYDIGTEYSPGNFTINNLPESKISSDMQAIKEDLHCNAIRIYGENTDKLILASGIALRHGLDVWISPRYINAGTEETLQNLTGLARLFQALKTKYPEREFVFIVGGEATIDTQGFVKGDTLPERLQNLMKPLFLIKDAFGIRPSFQKKLDEFLQGAAAAVRKEFAGKVTYASAMWEKIDWTPFDYIAVNLYKAAFNERSFERTLKKLIARGKPVIITEFGCCCHEGADKKGPMGYMVLDWSKSPPVFKETCTRNENVQARYITGLLETYQNYQVDGTFIFDFQAPKLAHNADPAFDFDMASFSITRPMNEIVWEPKESFHAIADFYNERETSTRRIARL